MDTAARYRRLSEALLERTRELHREVERSGIIAEILRGRATGQGYALLLRNLLPAYRQMEAGLERHRLDDVVGRVARREVYRSSALEADLAALCGPNWSRALPLLPAGEAYAARVAAAADGTGLRLVGHAYVRYLGDLSGGQILKRLLAKTLGLPPQALSFYEFPEIDDIEGFKQSYRSALDSAAPPTMDISPILDSAAEAFSLNFDISEAVKRAVLEGPASLG